MSTVIKKELDSYIGNTPKDKDLSRVTANDAELANQLYIAVVTTAMKGCIELQGLRVNNQVEWWKSNISRAHELATLVRDSYLERSKSNV